jgi:hypothetical protein
MTTTAAHASLLAELGAIWAKVPIPAGNWHPWLEEISQLGADVRAALAVVAADEDAASELERLLGEDEPPTTADDEPDALGAAIRRLAALPRPEGKHPFLEDLLPGLEAAELLLAAAASSPAARRRFGELDQKPARAVSAPPHPASRGPDVS